MHFTYRKWFNLGKLTSNHQGKSYLGLSISLGEKRMKDQTGEVNMWGCLKFSSYFPATSNATDFNKWGFLDGFNREVWGQHLIIIICEPDNKIISSR